MTSNNLDDPSIPKRNRISKFTALAVLIAVFTLYNPIPANAGFFSFLGNLIGKNKQSTQEITPNSQNIALLKATLNSDTNANLGGGDITIVNNSALLPDSGPLGTMADIEDAVADQDQISIYVVREGDNLSQIAKMFGVSVNTIIWTNDIKRGSLIKTGQNLVILPISGVQYAVKKGDTIAKIAKKYKGDADDIVDYNGINGSELVVGDTIIIPDGIDPTVRPVYRSYVRGSSGPSYSGYYIRPVAGGRRSQGLHGYNAIDIAAPVGTPVVASASGDVTISRGYGWNGGYGQYIVIKHPNGSQTLYGHLSRNIVSTGWHVVKGQVIGYVGNTGRSTGSHVHFEIRGARNPF
jgi:LysM repeat protein